MKKQLLGMIVGIGMVIAGAAATVVPTEAQAQSYRTDRAIARSSVRRARARRAYREDRAFSRRDIRRARARRAYRGNRGYRSNRAVRAYYRRY